MERKKIIFIVVGALLIFFALLSIFVSESAVLSFVSLLVLIISVPASNLLLKEKKPQKNQGGNKEQTNEEKNVKVQVKKKTSLDKEVEKISIETEDMLFEASTVFPFDLFPNKVRIGQKQIMLLYKQFFSTIQVYNLLLTDILTPVVESSIFFATLKLELGPGGFQQDPPPMKFLKKGDAFKARRIIMGLIILNRENIDLTNFSPKEIAEKAEEIGKIKSE